MSITERANEWLKAAKVNATVDTLTVDDTPEAMHLLQAVRAAVRAEWQLTGEAAAVRREANELISRLDKPSQIVNSLGEAQQAAPLNAACGTYSAASNAFEHAAAIYTGQHKGHEF